MARIIDAILVQKNSPNQPAELDQGVPVAAIAGQARRLDCEHGANTPLADRRQKALEAGSIGAAPRTAKIVINNLDRRPTELTRALGKAILSPTAFLIVYELVGSRLSDVDKRAAAQMLNGDLGHRRPPRRPVPLRFREAALLSAPQDGSSALAPGRQAARPDRIDLVGDLRTSTKSLKVLPMGPPARSDRH